MLDILNVDFPYRPRVGQLELAKFIIRNSGSERIILVSAPTGFGKTISILYASLKLLNEKSYDKIFYTVRTRNELDPVIKECKALGLDFSILYSIKRMCPIATSSNISSEGFWSVCTILRLRGECKYYVKTNTVRLTDVKDTINNSGDHISIARNLANKLGICPFFALLQLVDYVDVAIFTYPYVFKESIWAATFKDKNITRVLLVVDEAHNILNIGGVLGESIGLEDLKKSIDEALSLSAEDVAEVLRELLLRTLSEPITRGYRYVGKKYLSLDPKLIDRISDLVFTAIIKAMRDFEYKFNIEKLDFTLSRIAKFLSVAVNENYDIFASKDTHGHISLSVLPINFIPIRTTLERFPMSILMSGTPPSPEFISGCIGVSRDIKLVDVEDFGAKNYLRENTFTVIFTGATSSYRARSRETFDTYRKLVEAVHQYNPRGITLAVYPSYEVMYAITRELKRPDVIVEGLEPLPELMQKVLSKDKILLNAVAGGRLTEGVEFVVNGESLVRSVVIVGIPYPQPDDYVEILRKNIAKNRGSYTDYYRDIAVIRILQAVGRAIRSENDYAFIVLADKRYKNQVMLRKLKIQPKIVTNFIEKIIQLETIFYDQVRIY